MLKKIPYNDNLIQIGNAPVYAGKAVYSDGKVAYGWLYVPQHKNAPTGKIGPFGFWVGEEINNVYRLAGKDLLLGANITANNGHGDAQCYPCYATSGKLYKRNGGYNYNGLIVAMAGTGAMLTYDKFNLWFYASGGRYALMDMSPLRYNSGGTIQLIDAFKAAGTVDATITYSNAGRNNFQLSDVLGSYFDVLKQKVDDMGNKLYAATYTITPAGQTATSGSGIAGTDGVDTFVYDNNDNVIARTVADTSIIDSNGNLIARSRNGVLTIYDTAGNILYSGQGVIVANKSNVISRQNYTINCNCMAGYGTVKRIIRNNNVKVAETYGNNVIAYVNGNVSFDGEATLTYNNNAYAITPPWSSGTVARAETIDTLTRITTVAGYVIESQNNNITVKDEFANILFAGAGTLSVANDAYTVSCSWMSGNGQLDYNVMFGAVVIAESNGNNVTVRDANGNTLYSGQGTMAVTDTTHTITTPWMSGRESVIYNMHYTVSCPWMSGNGAYVTIAGNNTTVYSNSSMSHIIAESDGQTVTVYDVDDSVIYDGNGYIIALAGSYQTYNIQCLDLIGHGYVNRITSGNYKIYNGAGNLIVEYASANVNAYDANGNMFYSGIGTVNINAPYIRLIFGNYDGEGRIAATYGADATERKKYYVNNNGVVERSFPATLQLSQNAVLDLVNFDLTIGQQTYNNDPLGLTAGSGMIYPAGVHAWEKNEDVFIVSQDGHIIWHNGQTAQYAGIDHCYNLSWLNKIWN